MEFLTEIVGRQAISLPNVPSDKRSLPGCSESCHHCVKERLACAPIGTISSVWNKPCWSLERIVSISRTAFMNPDTKVDVVVAQFRFNPRTSMWTLYCADRDSRWQEYFDLMPSKKFDGLLQEVEGDPTGIFWG